MASTTDQEYQHLGETSGCKNHDHDLVHELSRRLDSLWRYDQYLANAVGLTDVEHFWSRIKEQEQANIEQLKKLISQHVAMNCF